MQNAKRLEVLVREDLEQSVQGLQRLETIVLKPGPRAFKTASLLFFGKSRESISKIELRLQTWDYSKAEGFKKKPDKNLAIQDKNEIGPLVTFLTTQLGGPGRYSLIEESEPIAKLIEAIPKDEDHTPIITAITKQLKIGIKNQEAASDEEYALETVARVKREASVTRELKALIDNPSASEQDFQKLLEDNWWLLGSAYIARFDRRKLTLLDQNDILLQRADGIVHIIELKKANVPDLVKSHRNHCTVGSSVNEAVNQAANYLRSTDEKRAQILADLKIDCRRAYATVVIGSGQYNRDSTIKSEEINETLRTFNSHLSRIEITTYDEIYNMAKRITNSSFSKLGN